MKEMHASYIVLLLLLLLSTVLHPVVGLTTQLDGNSHTAENIFVGVQQTTFNGTLNYGEVLTIRNVVCGSLMVDVYLCPGSTLSLDNVSATQLYFRSLEVLGCATFCKFPSAGLFKPEQIAEANFFTTVSVVNSRFDTRGVNEKRAFEFAPDETSSCYNNTRYKISVKDTFFKARNVGIEISTPDSVVPDNRYSFVRDFEFVRSSVVVTECKGFSFVKALHIAGMSRRHPTIPSQLINQRLHLEGSFLIRDCKFLCDCAHAAPTYVQDITSTMPLVSIDGARTFHDGFFAKRNVGTTASSSPPTLTVEIINNTFESAPARSLLELLSFGPATNVSVKIANNDFLSSTPYAYKLLVSIRVSKPLMQSAQLEDLRASSSHFRVLPPSRADTASAATITMTGSITVANNRGTFFHNPAWPGALTHLNSVIKNIRIVCSSAWIDRVFVEGNVFTSNSSLIADSIVVETSNLHRLVAANNVAHFIFTVRQNTTALWDDAPNCDAVGIRSSNITSIELRNNSATGEMIQIACHANVVSLRDVSAVRDLKIDRTRFDVHMVRAFATRDLLTAPALTVVGVKFENVSDRVDKHEASSFFAFGPTVAQRSSPASVVVSDVQLFVQNDDNYYRKGPPQPNPDMQTNDAIAVLSFGLSVGARSFSPTLANTAVYGGFVPAPSGTVTIQRVNTTVRNTAGDVLSGAVKFGQGRMSRFLFATVRADALMLTDLFCNSSHAGVLVAIEIANIPFDVGRLNIVGLETHLYGSDFLRSGDHMTVRLWIFGFATAVEMRNVRSVQYSAFVSRNYYVLTLALPGVCSLFMDNCTLHSHTTLFPSEHQVKSSQFMSVMFATFLQWAAATWSALERQDAEPAGGGGGAGVVYQDVGCSSSSVRIVKTNITIRNCRLVKHSNVFGSFLVWSMAEASVEEGGYQRVRIKAPLSVSPPVISKAYIALDDIRVLFFPTSSSSATSSTSSTSGASTGQLQLNDPVKDVSGPFALFLNPYCEFASLELSGIVSGQPMLFADKGYFPRMPGVLSQLALIFAQRKLGRVASLRFLASAAGTAPRCNTFGSTVVSKKALALLASGGQDKTPVEDPSLMNIFVEQCTTVSRSVTKMPPIPTSTVSFHKTRSISDSGRSRSHSRPVLPPPGPAHMSASQGAVSVMAAVASLAALPGEAMSANQVFVGLALIDGCPRNKYDDDFGGGGAGGRSVYVFDKLPYPLTLAPSWFGDDSTDAAAAGSYLKGALLSYALVFFGFGVLLPLLVGLKAVVATRRLKSMELRAARLLFEEEQDQQRDNGDDSDDMINSSAASENRREERRRRRKHVKKLERELSFGSTLVTWLSASPLAGFALNVMAATVGNWGLIVGVMLASDIGDLVKIGVAVLVVVLLIVLVTAVCIFLVVKSSSESFVVGAKRRKQHHESTSIPNRRIVVVRSTRYFSKACASPLQRSLRDFLLSDWGRFFCVGEYAWSARGEEQKQDLVEKKNNDDGDINNGNHQKEQRDLDNAAPPPTGFLVVLSAAVQKTWGPCIEHDTNFSNQTMRGGRRSNNKHESFSLASSSFLQNNSQDRNNNSGNRAVCRSARYLACPFYLIMFLLISVVVCILQGAALEKGGDSSSSLCTAARVVNFCSSLVTLFASAVLRPYLVSARNVLAIFLSAWCTLVALICLPGVVASAEGRALAKNVLGFLTVPLMAVPVLLKVATKVALLGPIVGSSEVVPVSVYRQHVKSLLAKTDVMMTTTTWTAPVVVGASSSSSPASRSRSDSRRNTRQSSSPPPHAINDHRRNNSSHPQHQRRHDAPSSPRRDLESLVSNSRSPEHFATPQRRIEELDGDSWLGHMLMSPAARRRRGV